MHGVAEKAATSASFSERFKTNLGIFFPFTMGTVTGDEIDTQEEGQDNDKIDASECQVSLNSSNHENEAPSNMEIGYSDRFVSLRRRLLMKYSSQENS